MHLFKMKSTSWYNSLLVKKSIKTNCIILLIAITYLIWYRFTHLGIPCVFHMVTDLYCPGCGVTRMFLALFNLEFAEAFRNNSFVFILLPYGFFVYIRHYAYIAIKGEAYTYKKYHSFIISLILILAVVFAVVRNIPNFHFLTP